MTVNRFFCDLFPGFLGSPHSHTSTIPLQQQLEQANQKSGFNEEKYKMQQVMNKSDSSFYWYCCVEPAAGNFDLEWTVERLESLQPTMSVIKQ